MRLWRRKSKLVNQSPPAEAEVDSSSAPSLSILVLDNLFKKLDVQTLLNARGVCHEWFDYITTYMLANRCCLRVNPRGRDRPKWRNSRQLKKWFPAMSVNWNEIQLEELETSKILWKTNMFDFGAVSALTILESDFTLKDFVSDVMTRMTSLRHLKIFDHDTSDLSSYHFGFDTFSAVGDLNRRHLKRCKQGYENLHRIETFSLGIYCWYTSVIYIRLICFTKPVHLREIYLDFSRILGPICRSKLRETFDVIGKLVTNSMDSLEILKLKFTRRVETTQDLILYGMRVEVFHEFLESLPQWPQAEKLRLKCIKLLLPNIALEHSYVEAIFVPFLKSLPKLDKLFLGRCHLDPAFYQFHLQFQRVSGLKLSYSMFHNDFEPAFGIFTGYPLTKSIELQTLWSVGFSPSLIANRIYWARSGFLDRAAKVKSFRAINSRFNVHFRLFNVPDILATFPNLEELELLDNSMPHPYCPENHLNVALIGNEHFNKILEAYPRLRSLKLSSLPLLTDSGITGLPESVLKRMEAVGSYNLRKDEQPGFSPLANMKELQYLELRNLSKSVSDISVYITIKNIPKLEKVAFHGEHRITKWGTKVLKQRFRRNSLFKVYLKQKLSSSIPTDFP